MKSCCLKLFDKFESLMIEIDNLENFTTSICRQNLNSNRKKSNYINLSIYFN